MKNFKKKEGITLVALVVTIVILLILAGVSINMVLGENGLIVKAKEAREATEKASIRDVKELAMLNASANTENWIYTDENGDTAVIPSGFSITGINEESIIDNGLVIIDKNGNEFVWIPVSNISEYKRVPYSNVGKGEIDIDTNSEKFQCDNYYYIEKMAEDEKISIEKYKGFYIGRYETGEKEATESKIYRNQNSNVEGIVTIKCLQSPYNYVTRNQAITLSKNMANEYGYTTSITKLCSSYAWDTTINFIQKTNNDYSISSKEGNYKNADSFKYLDLTGKQNLKQKGEGILIPTGQTIPVNNIYDMGGNMWEWTSEFCSQAYCDCTYRGGLNNKNYDERPAGYRRI